MKKLLSLVIAIAIIITAIPAIGTSEAPKIYQNTVFAIDGVSTEPAIATNGEDFVLKVNVRNASGYDLSQVKVSLREIGSGKTNKYFSLNEAVDGNSDARVVDMASGEAFEFQYALKADHKLSCGKYPVTLSFKVGENEFVDRVRVEVFRDTDVIQPGSNDGPDGVSDVMSGNLPKFPDGKDPAKPAEDQGTCPKDPTDPNKPEDPSDNSKPNKPNKPDDSKKPDDNGTGDVPPPSMPQGGGDGVISGGGGSSLSGEVTSEKVKNKPKLIIDKYHFSPDAPMAGDEFTMYLSFYNTNADKGVRNIKIFLTSADTAVSADSKDTKMQGSSVFTPVNSSNTFFIGYIAPWDTVQKAITLSTSPTLAPKNYQVVANFEYEDKDGNEYTAQELIGIPIVQKARLQTSEITMPPEAFMGQSVESKIQFYNTGKDTLYNLMVQLEGDFAAEEKQYYVGNFQSGSSDSFQLDFKPNKPGENKGKILFTYEDSTGKEQKMEKDFSLVVQEEKMPDPNAMPDGMMPNEMNEPPKASLFTNPIVLGMGAVLIGVAGFVVYKKKKHKKEQEDLTIDEDS